MSVPSGSEFLAGNLQLDFTVYWTWFLLFTRMSGLFNALPGIGTDQVPASFRLMPAMVLSACITLGGIRAHPAQSLPEGALMVGSEYALGYVLGFVPQLVIGGLTVAGQLVSGAIGLAQANMLDISLGESISLLSHLKAQLATLIFLAMDGHHIIIRAAAGAGSEIGLGGFRPDGETFQILFHRFVESFHLAIVVSAPIIVSALLTQFVLGLVTKFVPQMNIFVISMPLTLIAGLYIVTTTFPGFFRHTEREFGKLEETLSSLLLDRSPPASAVPATPLSALQQSAAPSGGRVLMP